MSTVLIMNNNTLFKSSFFPLAKHAATPDLPTAETRKLGLSSCRPISCSSSSSHKPTRLYRHCCPANTPLHFAQTRYGDCGNLVLLITIADNPSWHYLSLFFDSSFG